MLDDSEVMHSGEVGHCASELLFMDPATARQKILQLEAALRHEIAEGRVIENTDTMPLAHAFIPGGYARELTIPAGTLIVGKTHRGPCFNFVMRGQITVLTEHGIKTITAPAHFVSEGGTKRVGVAHTDTVWINVHGTNETDLDKLEAELTYDTEDIGLIENATKEIA